MLGCRLDKSESVGDFHKIFRALLGQADFPVRAMEKLKREKILKHPDLPANRAWGNAKLGGRERETELSPGALEGT
ncbi:hypothetical protein SBA_ch2_5270 [Sphingomonas bisphenolicum]|uniref:Uncharacterized protein n=1 Tax=Sphingomonas bisphenolicum TaxID=296544 RepID=A0ABM7G9Z7_9SPHN|nr:hypothetical protein SBA_ch2_5270 [Sphingomonas bisphenolicum]